jgi:phosphomannomutase
MIKFGTDGWRAVISDEFTFDNVKMVAQAMADYILSQKDVLKKRDFKIVVGYDTRFLSYKYAEITACITAPNGIPTILTDRASPTPSASYAIKDRNLIGGIVITASHNPARYNGMKYKAYYAGSADTGITKSIEALLGVNQVKFKALKELKENGILAVEDIVSRHLAFIKKFVDLKLIRNSNMKVLVDPMYGVGNSYIADLLKGGRIKIDTIHDDANPGFGGINPEPIMPNLKELADKTKKGKYSIGLATDGDADRLGIALPDGKLLTGHKIMALLLLHFLEDRNAKGDVVQTICGTELIEKICEKYGRKMHETPVGFKYICDTMQRKDVLIGGEETGGVAFKGYIPERDGILSGLLILEMMASKRKKIQDILKSMDKEYGTYEYRRLDMRVPDDKKGRLMGYIKNNPLKKVLDKEVMSVKDYDGFKFICKDGSWLMLRLSGTEPIVRVYSEAPTEKAAFKILDFGKSIIEKV